MLLATTQSEMNLKLKRLKALMRRRGMHVPRGLVKVVVEPRIAGLPPFWRMAGYYLDGVIHMPMIRLLDTDMQILAHEIGHAMAHRCGKPSWSRDFRAAFGAGYGTARTPLQMSEHCVSDYACTSTQEDFAESFAYYVLNGCAPADATLELRDKFAFIARRCA